MKKIHLIYMGFAAVALTSCTFEQDDYFDESAALRITHVNDALKSQLVAQSDTTQGKYGWAIQYFVAGTDEFDFEGFNLFGRFTESGKVTLGSNHRYLRNGNAGKYTEHSSTYEMLGEEGPVLSFNTWNDILTVFEDPVDPDKAPEALVNNGEGMYGDHNLVLRSYNDEEIVFRGERHSAAVRFVPCDRPWQQYLEDTEKLKSTITNGMIGSYYVTNGTDTLYFVNLRRGRFNYADRVVDPLKYTSIACCFTPNGFHLENEQTLGTNTFQDFTLTADSTCLISENDSVRVIPCWDNYMLGHTAVWQFSAEDFSAEQQTLFSQINEELKKSNANFELTNIGWGRSTGSAAVNGLVFTFYSNAAHTKTNTCGIALTVERVKYGQFRFSSGAEDVFDKNLKSISNKATELPALVKSFVATISDVYEVTPDNVFLPTGGEFNPLGSGARFVIK